MPHASAAVLRVYFIVTVCPFYCPHVSTLPNRYDWFSGWALWDSAQHSALFPVVGVQDIAVRRVVAKSYPAFGAFYFGSDGLAQCFVVGLDRAAVGLIIGCLQRGAGECDQD